MRITVDPIGCEAHGLCAELLPEAITLDDWGYPLIDGDELAPSLERLARRAASACPTLALRLEVSRRAVDPGPAARGPAARDRDRRQ
ncbi:MAG: ferredoxin [Solirubrobacteraceae bacterium]